MVKWDSSFREKYDNFISLFHKSLQTKVKEALTAEAEKNALQRNDETVKDEDVVEGIFNINRGWSIDILAQFLEVSGFNCREHYLSLNPEKKNYGQVTLMLINDLLSKGVKKISVILRHSARYYDYGHPERDAFLGLTEEGKDFAFQFGKNISQGPLIGFFSSYTGRCLETAYLIDKGYSIPGGETFHPKINNVLAGEFQKSDEVWSLMGSDFSGFVRKWFDGNISEDLIANAKRYAFDIVQFLSDELNKAPENCININSSHDMHLFLLREFYLGLRHEDAGGVEYLEGVVLFEKDAKLFITHHLSEPKRLMIKQ